MGPSDLPLVSLEAQGECSRRQSGRASNERERDEKLRGEGGRGNITPSPMLLYTADSRHIETDSTASGRASTQLMPCMRRCMRCIACCVYDKLAPTRVCDLQTPSFVLIRCVDLVSGSIQAASSVSRVVKPGWTVSQTFFFGFSCASGVASAGQHDTGCFAIRRPSSKAP
jgi:hypothetical protein